MIARTRPDVVLMDIRMPRMDGLTATRRLSEERDPPQVIVLTTFDADEHVVQALALGAKGFLLKDTSPPMIVEAIEKVAAGQPILSPSVTAQLIRKVTSGPSGDVTAERTRAAAARLSQLSDRERDVAVAVGQGKSKCGDRRRTLHERRHGQGAHLAHLREDAVRQPRPARDLRARGRPRLDPGPDQVPADPPQPSRC